MKNLTHARCGFSLVEVALALGIAGFCLIALFGLLPVGINSNRASLEQTAAADIASRVWADIATTPQGSSKSSYYSIPLSGTYTLYFNEGGEFSLSASAMRYRFQLDFGTPTNGVTTPVRILVTWPAPATPQNAQGSFETVTGLNRT